MEMDKILRSSVESLRAQLQLERQRSKNLQILLLEKTKSLQGLLDEKTEVVKELRARLEGAGREFRELEERHREVLADFQAKIDRISRENAHYKLRSSRYKQEAAALRAASQPRTPPDQAEVVVEKIAFFERKIELEKEKSAKVLRNVREGLKAVKLGLPCADGLALKGTGNVLEKINAIIAVFE